MGKGDLKYTQERTELLIKLITGGFEPLRLILQYFIVYLIRAVTKLAQFPSFSPNKSTYIKLQVITKKNTYELKNASNLSF